MKTETKTKRKVFGFLLATPGQRGYWCGAYNLYEAPRECPGCGRRHWIVGRQLAECGFCATAIPIVQSASGSTVIVHKNMTRQAERHQPIRQAA